MFIIRAGILVITTAISSAGDRSDSTFKLISIWPLAYVTMIIHVEMECPINAITSYYNILHSYIYTISARCVFVFSIRK